MPETELKISPQEVERLRAALERAESRLRQSQAEFQDFVAKVSHDMREPLRTISAYSQLLAAKAVTGDEEVALYLRFIQDGMDRGQVLLSAMVDYASADGDRIRPVPVDMNAVFMDATSRIKSGAAITHDPLPKVIGDFELLSKVLLQLIDNAVKFAGRPDPEVHVSARADGDDWIFAVRDNGPGIEPAHHDRIFGLFKRLHGREYPGYGLGLAFVRKALDPLGGRVWLESAPGQGSTFYFSVSSAD